MEKCALAYITLRTGVKKNFQHSRLYCLDIIESSEEMTSSLGVNLPSNREDKGVRGRYAGFKPPPPLGQGEGGPTGERRLDGRRDYECLLQFNQATAGIRNERTEDRD